MTILRAILLTLLLAAAVPATAAEWVLVANPKAGIARLSLDEVINIYLGRYRRLASGITAEPLDQPADSVLRARFYRRLVDKSLPEIQAYWARLLFSGQTQPPRVAASSDEALQFVAGHPGALVYVERSKVDGRVVVVFELTD